MMNLYEDISKTRDISFAGDVVQFSLNREVTGKIKKLGLKEGTTLFMTLLAAFNVLLAKYTGQEEIVVGSPIAGRQHKDLENVIGMFVNTLALRSKVTADKSFREFLAETKEMTLNAYKNQDYQFERLIEKLHLERNTDQNPLFNVMFNLLQNIERAEIVLANMTIRPFKFTQNIAKMNLTLNAIEFDDFIQMNLEYRTRLFTRETIERMANHLVMIIKEVVNNPDSIISEISILTEEEEDQLLREFNDTERPFDSKKTVHQLFEEHVDRTPDQVALIQAENHITYTQLNQKANQLARILRGKGVEPDSIIGIMCERSFAMIIGMLAVLKAGGAYLPIDPGYPVKRIQYIIDDSNIKMLLTDKVTADRIIEFKQSFHNVLTIEGTTISESSVTLSDEKVTFTDPVILIDEARLYQGDGSNLKNVNNIKDLAYVIYTSGSTGQPKGVMIEHKGLANLKTYFKEDCKVKETDRIVQFASCAFDASAWEIYMALLTGATLHIIETEQINNYENFQKYLNEHQITIITLPPIYLNKLNLEEISTLETLITAGSAPHPELVNYWKEKFRYINAYGPTEATICTTYWEYSELSKMNKSVPIGVPIINTKVYILDNNNKMVPIGVVGELCISGVGVARGYLNKPELTAEKFVDNPFEPGQILYKTGDLARWLLNGNIEFVGRKDDQVKIRGFRIELGEIENILLKHVEIKEAGVIKREDTTGTSFLCAYFTCDGQLSSDKLREFLGKELPEYMIPNYFVQLDQIPVTSNGKIDHQALMKMDRLPLQRQEYVPPNGEVEESIARIWAEVLGVENVGRRDNFFNLGGDSIKAIQVVARLQQNNLRLDTRDLLQYQTIEELVHYVRLVNRVIDDGLVLGEIPLTPIQHWFFENHSSDPHHYNQAVMLYSLQGFVVPILEQVMQKLIEHHDILRVIYSMDGGIIRQIGRGMEGELFTLQIFDLTQDFVVEDTIQNIANQLQASIDLTQGSLVKLGLFQTRNGDHLLWIVHHLAVDGVSWRILLEDFAIGYRSLLQNQEIIFPFKTESFKAWAEAEQFFANTEPFLHQLEYWQSIEEMKVPALCKSALEDNLSCQSEHSDDLTITFSLEDTQFLVKELHESSGLEINAVLLTPLLLAIRDWVGHEQIAVALEGHGREEIFADLNVSRTVGWFTSIYPVVFNLSEQTSLIAQLQEVGKTLGQIPDKGVGYGIIKYLTSPEKKEQISWGLKPEISFNYLGQFDQDLKQHADIFEISRLSPGVTISPQNEVVYPISINGLITKGVLHLTFTFAKGWFSTDKRSGLTKLYKSYLEQLIDLGREGELLVMDKFKASFREQELLAEEMDFITEFVEGLELVIEEER